MRKTNDLIIRFWAIAKSAGYPNPDSFKETMEKTQGLKPDTTQAYLNYLGTSRFWPETFEQAIIALLGESEQLSDLIADDKLNKKQVVKF